MSFEMLQSKTVPPVTGSNPIQAKRYNGLRVAPPNAAPVQRSRETAQAALEQSQPNHTGLPDNLRAGVESLSGMDLSDVRVHYNSDRPTRLQALAYTQGTDIHVATGQEQHLPHEAWHVVQQVQGRVQPTMQLQGLGGVGVNDDAGLEHEAGEMGERALTTMTGSNLGSGPCIADGPGGKSYGPNVDLRIINMSQPIQCFWLWDSIKSKLGIRINVTPEVKRKLQIAHDAIAAVKPLITHGPQNQAWARQEHGDEGDVNMSAMMDLVDRKWPQGGYNANWTHPRRIGAAVKLTGGGNCQDIAALSYNYLREHADNEWDICFVVAENTHHTFATIGDPTMDAPDEVIVADAWVRYPKELRFSEHFCRNERSLRVYRKKRGVKPGRFTHLEDKYFTQADIAGIPADKDLIRQTMLRADATWNHEYATSPEWKLFNPEYVVPRYQESTHGPILPI